MPTPSLGKAGAKQTRAAANSYNLQLQGQPGGGQAQQRGTGANTQSNKTAGYVDMIHKMQSDNNGVKLNSGTAMPESTQNTATSSNKTMVRPSNLLQQNTSA